MLDVAVVRRETELALQLVFWNELKGHHDIQWAPKQFVKTEVHAGDRNVSVEVCSTLGQLQGWDYLIQNERDEHRANMERYT